MGVPVGEAAGDYPALMRCSECDARYETDETVDNYCPECGGFGENVTPTDEMKADPATEGVYDASYWREA